MSFLFKSKKKSSGKKTPKPAGQIIRQDGIVQASNLWNKNKNRYEANIFRTPEQQQVGKFADSILTGLQGQWQNDPYLGAGGAQAAEEAIFNPMAYQINQQFDTATGNFLSSMGDSGMMNSSATGESLARNLVSERARQLADAKRQALLGGQEFRANAITPYQNMGAFAQGLNAGTLQPGQAAVGPAMQGSAQANAFNQNNYQLQGANPVRSTGIMSRLFGG